MGRLKNFLAYLDDRAATLGDVEKRLCALQGKYETFFTEVSAVRESELGQLSELITKNRGKLPLGLDAAIDEAQREVEKKFDLELERLRGEHRKLADDSERVRQRSSAKEAELHHSNVTLDAQEEELKERNQRLLARIADYNRRIAEMGSGFGFFKNLFAMRRLQAERRAIDDEHAVVASRIDQVRQAWAAREAEDAKRQAEQRQMWIDLTAQAAAVQSKIDYLVEARPRIIFRSTLERVLYERFAELPVPTAADPKCKRCGSANPAASHFCQICAQRLLPDRPDLEGSIQEIAEVNHHFVKFSEGMKACQQLIGLVRGLASGVASFRKSVESVRTSESKYPLPKLEINVPAASVQFGHNFDALRQAVSQDLSLHPKVFGEHVEQVTANVLTEQNIKSYFETMGEELSRCAKSQWG
jgi:hypothetical protein